MTKANEATGWYETVFKGWETKLLGRKPTAAELHSIHMLGARPGKQALASAMALRECGVTRGQVDIACGAPQFNKMRAFRAAGVLKRESVPPTAEGHTVYKYALTAKGTAAVAKAEAAPQPETGDKPAKGKGKAKPKAKGKPKAEKPVTEPVNEPAGNPVMAAAVTAISDAANAAGE